MSPNLPMDDVFDVGLSDTVLVSQCPLGKPTGSILDSYFNHLYLCEFMVADFFTLSVIKFSLPRSILKIILHSAKKQMGWINARRIVALVKNVKTVRNFTIVKYPRNSARWHELLSKPKRAVPSASPASNPLPTISKLCSNDWTDSGHFPPKPLLNRAPSLTCKFTKFWTNLKLGIILVLHKSAALICATSPAIHGAGAPLYPRFVEGCQHLHQPI